VRRTVFKGRQVTVCTGRFR